MKQVLFILLLTTSGLIAQVAAPDLRCLEVLQNGNVKLTWIAPSDPSNLFFSYKIFSSNSPTSSFTLAGTVGAISTTTFVHSGNAGGTSLYYYLITEYGSAGANSSPHSDTLRSIFLNLIPGSVDLKLVYNQLKQPKLPSSNSNFSILKEYPLGTWSLFGTTPNINYQDTLTVCQDSMSYQITLADNSGCISSSNIQRGQFTDQKPPNEPYMDSISVLPNGQTVLAWRIPRDEDIVKYKILKKTGGINSFYSTVNGRLSTIYTYTPNDALTQMVELYVAAQDSCNNISTFNDLPNTMYLITSYDICGYQTQLNWNEYKGMHKGILEYRIYYSVNGAAFNQVGSTTGTNFLHTRADAGKNLCYYVRVVNTEGTITASSNRSCFFSKQVKAPNYVYVKKATVLSDKSIQVNVLLDTSVVSTGVEIHRSEDGVNYSNTGFVPYNSTRHYAYTDETVETGKMPYYYKAIVRDSCGNIRNKSNVAKTMLLKVQQDKSLLFTQHLSWNEYLGFGGGVSGYNIYRIVDHVLERSPIGFADSQTFTYTDDLENDAQLGAQIDYLVEAVEGISNPFLIKEHSFSNEMPVYVEGRLFVPNAFAPDGKNKTWLPITHFIDKSDYKVLVYDRWGSKVFESSRDDEAWDGGNLGAGVFVYLISYKNARGEYQQAKGTVYLVR